MHVHSELIVVLLACDALLLGALMRLSARGTKIPYTVTMLLLGFGIGLLLNYFRADTPFTQVLEVIDRGAHISPHAIILVFLPALVFESAFALDAHAFRRDIGAVALLAVPALLISTVAIGGLMVALTSISWGWSLTAGLVFGALISATDPVAVVAILRETAAPKRLGVLIEGESLLNDGTAIVVFTVLFGVLAAGGLGDIEAGKTATRFLWVVSGGVGVGLVFAVGGAFLIGRTFNDAMVEITVTIVIAYASMIVAEEILHVSGVLAVVTAGIYMSSRGRTRISPEVQHFLHQFWEMLAYIANTLIFFVVGLVIAAQVEHARWTDIALILATYAGVIALRFAITFAFKPLIGKVAQPVTTKEATVMAWGGLRGAVSLALALIIARSDTVEPALGQQILLVTAGVVMLTILVNGSTTGRLLDRLGFSTPPLGERIAELSAVLSVLDATLEEIDRVEGSRDLRTVSWGEVRADLTDRREALGERLSRARKELETDTGADRDAGHWLQALSIERQAYWSAFGRGTLGAMATTLLDSAIDTHVDDISEGRLEPPTSRTQTLGGKTGFVARLLRGRGGFRAGDFDRLALLYDLARGQTLGAEGVLGDLDQLKGIDPHDLDRIRDTYRSYARAGVELIEDLRSNLPEVTLAIETKLARRIQLNFERDGYQRLTKRGVLSSAACETALGVVEREMKRLRSRPKQVELPETAVVCRNTPLFRALDEAALAELAEITIEEVLSPGDVLFDEGDEGDSMYVVVRGAVHVVRTVAGEDTVIEALGGGEVVGEMALLTGEPRSATIRAATTVTLGRIDRESFEHVMEKHEHLRKEIWHAHCLHQFDNHVETLQRYRALSHADRVAWICDAPIRALSAGEALELDGGGSVFVAFGIVEIDGAEVTGPALVDPPSDNTVTARTDARLVPLPATPVGRDV